MSDFAFKSLRNPALLILEGGVNHDGNVLKAHEMIDSAASTGADFIKFQTYTAKRLAAPYSPAYWNLSEEPTTSQFELFSKYDAFKAEDYIALADHCSSKSIGFLTTCFDEEWLEILDPYLVMHKIASADITNFPLVDKVARKRKPILLSTGAAFIEEIADALEVIRTVSDEPVCLLHCVLNYPTHHNNANLLRLRDIAGQFPNIVLGYSDHTKPDSSFQALALAFALGSRVFEKHFTLNKAMPGNDHYHSFDAQDVTKFVMELQTTDEMLTYDESRFIEAQQSARLQARRGIYAKKRLPIGSVIDEKDVICLRPTTGAEGFASNDLVSVIGKYVVKEIGKLEPILKSDLA